MGGVWEDLPLSLKSEKRNKPRVTQIKEPRCWPGAIWPSVIRTQSAAEVLKAQLGSTGLKTFASGKSVLWSQRRVSRASEGEKPRTRLYGTFMSWPSRPGT